MKILSQRDPRWSDITLGTGKGNIGLYGCTITSLAMIIGTTPDVVNTQMINNGGFAQGNLVIWSQIPAAFPGINIVHQFSYDNDAVLQAVPNVLVEVPATAIGGSGKHWVVFVGNHNCYDPWTGTQRPVSDFTQYGAPSAYCTVSGSWTEAQPQTPFPHPVNNDILVQFDRTLTYLTTISVLFDNRRETYLGNTKFLDSLKALHNADQAKAQQILELQTALASCRNDLSKPPVILPVAPQDSPTVLGAIRSITYDKWSILNWTSRLHAIKHIFEKGI